MARNISVALIIVVVSAVFISVNAQTGAFSYNPFMSIEKSLYNSRSDLEYSRNTDESYSVEIEPADIFAFGSSLKYNRYFSTGSLSVTWAESNFDAFIDLNAGVSLSNYLCYIGISQCINGEGEVFSPAYIGIQAGNDIGLFYLKNNLQFKAYDPGSDLGCYNLALSAKIYKSHEFCSPYLYCFVNQWYFEKDHKKEFFDYTSVGIGIGVNFFSFSNAVCDAVQGVRSVDIYTIF